MPTYSKLVLPAEKRRSRRLFMMIRVMWRDTSALLREFRRPILLFVFVTVFGGWFYGELHVLAGNERIPFVDLPYIMTALMILETPIEVPREPYLIFFWYLMPPLFVYIIGLGAADFVRLFFNRNERRDAWEEAVASTYRHHVIVLGAGHVGFEVIRALSAMGFEVIAIEMKLSSELDEELSEMGVPAIVGDGRTSAVLNKAGIAHADAFVACTSNDHVNLEAIMRVRDMNPDIRIVARMWDDKFSSQLKAFMGVQSVMSSSHLVAPSFAGAAVGIEITQTMTVHGVEYSMIRLTVEEGSFLEGHSIAALQDEQNIDIVLYGDNGDTIVHPPGSTMVKAGDILVVFAEHSKITEIVMRNRKPGKTKRRLLGRSGD